MFRADADLQSERVTPSPCDINEANECFFLECRNWEQLKLLCGSSTQSTFAIPKKERVTYFHIVICVIEEIVLCFDKQAVFNFSKRILAQKWRPRGLSRLHRRLFLWFPLGQCSTKSLFSWMRKSVLFPCTGRLPRLVTQDKDTLCLLLHISQRTSDIYLSDAFRFGKDEK